MREIPRQPDSPRFVLKAINEAGRELMEELYGVRGRDADRRAGGGYSPRQIAAHVRDNERMTLGYIERISSSRRPPTLPAIDVECALDDPTSVTESIERLLGEFASLRSDTLGILWSLAGEEWNRAGRHQYRGELTLIQIARELHLHDLEYLWQVRRIREAIPPARRADRR